MLFIVKMIAPKPITYATILSAFAIIAGVATNMLKNSDGFSCEVTKIDPQDFTSGSLFCGTNTKKEIVMYSARISNLTNNPLAKEAICSGEFFDTTKSSGVEKIIRPAMESALQKHLKCN